MPSQISILYWKEIPVQVKAENDETAVSIPLDHRFQEAADAVAMMDGSYGNDAYLDAWQWGHPAHSELDPQAAADELAQRIDKGTPRDLVARIRDLRNSSNRIEQPGAIDHYWVE